MEKSRDVDVLRRLADQVVEISRKPIQNEKRELWRGHNSLRRTRPPVYVRWFLAMAEVIPDGGLECTDPFYRRYERALRTAIFQDLLGDDTIVEPWVTVQASRITPAEGLWGMAHERIRSQESGGSWKDLPAIREMEDAAKLVAPHHRIDEEATAHDAARLQAAIGDLIEINVDRSPAYLVYEGDISTQLCYLRGLEQVMWDMHDNPEFLHRLLAFMRDGILAVHAEAEAAGDWHLANHQNQAMPYSLEIPDPCANGPSVKRSQLWCYMQAQELTLISPRMFDEFMLQYQMPIMAPFGLVAYGCCEDLTNKIPYLRQVPNLRRIAVTPWADLPTCAEQIGEDYVLSWRPNPAEMLSTGFEGARIRQILREGLAVSRGCHIEIVLKDVHTLEGHPERLFEWVQIAREAVAGF